MYIYIIEMYLLYACLCYKEFLSRSQNGPTVAQPSLQVVAKKKVHIFAQGSVLMRHLGTPSVFWLAKKNNMEPQNKKFSPQKNSSSGGQSLDLNSEKSFRILRKKHVGMLRNSEILKDPRCCEAWDGSPYKPFTRVLNTLVFFSFHVLPPRT